VSLNASTAQSSNGSPIAGSVLPIKRAEELLLTLPGVMAARIIASDAGAVDEIHLLTTADVNPKQTVRNVESALIAHLGMRVDHRKISVATTVEPQKAVDSQALQERDAAVAAAAEQVAALLKRRLYFEDVEVRRSRTRGVTCRVTLRKGDESYLGEAEGVESERSRVELAARAAVHAIAEAEGTENPLLLEGCKLVDAFDRSFVFVGIMAHAGRDAVLLAGTCEIKDSPEIASVLAVLDATNRWIARER
jgi:hypothetical protein